MSRAVSLRSFLRQLGLAATGLTLAGGAAAGAATAAERVDRTQPPVVFAITDPEGDYLAKASSGPEVDLLSAEVVQDRAEGVIRASVTLAGPPTGSLRARLHVAFGVRFFDECSAGGSVNGTAHLTTELTGTAATYSLTAPTPIGGPATRAVDGATIAMASESKPVLFSARGWECVKVDLEMLDGDGRPVPFGIYDTAEAWVEPSGSGQPGATPLGPDGQPIVNDRDRDGVSDASDRCPDQAGAKTNGCPATAPGRAMRLGARRLAMDHLLERTGEAACPVSVKVTVTAGRRRVARRSVGVVPRGAYCHLAGKVTLSRRASKVKVVITGKGLRTVRGSVKR